MKLTETLELLHGDCLDLFAKVPAGSVASIITDPPYFLGMTHNGHKGCFNDLTICKPFYETLFSEYKRVLQPDGCVYFFCDWRGYAFYYPIMSAIFNIAQKRIEAAVKEKQQELCSEQKGVVNA